ncbi:MAG: Aromatic/aminoadipate aminotransferase 1 [Geoglossum umbratile]|nr:MAG: Aromatic/aminoadipate aminotransferase 1 [Geoglossum umbratile]
MAPPMAVAIHPVSETTTIAPLDPLTVGGVAKRRNAAGRLNCGVAAMTCSDLFKGTACHKKKAKKWDHHMSRESLSREPSSLKGAASYLKIPGLISLGGGLPSSENFPIEHLDVKVPAVGRFSEAETKESGVILRAGKHDFAEGRSLYDLSIALNYGQGTGSAQLLRFVTEHTEIVHKPPYQDWRCALTVGSTSSLDMTYRLFTRPGDCILTEEYTFPTAVETAAPMGVRTIGIRMDEQGLIPSHMDEILSNWDQSKRQARRPILLYTVPSGQNPTGATQGLERRKELYKVAQKYDLYIIEDEPYYFLQMEPYTKGGGAPPAPPPATHEDFLKALVPSLLSMDIDGRVMRLDSFSKVIAPGSRVGWVTASEQIIECIIRHNEVSTQNPSGISQLIIWKLLDESWGHSGYMDWLVHLRKEYTKRRNVILKACEDHLPARITSYNPPAAGMFLWIKVNPAEHPDFGYKGLAAIENEIFQACIERGVLLSLGSWFCAERHAPHKDLFFRATFAAAESEQMGEAIRRFGEALRVIFRTSE